MHAKQLFDLTGKVAVITGGSIGLGRQIAQGLAEMGAHLVLCARKVERCKVAAKELRALGVEVLALRCDVAKQDEVESVIQETVKHFGTIDVLVNNAGIAWGAPAEEMVYKDWQKVLAVNLDGTFLFCQAVGQVMLQKGKGSIINVASVGGLVGFPIEVNDAVSYNASKGAVISLTRDLACKWAKRGINVNAIAPGWFPTHMTEWLFEHKADALLSRIPLGRFGGEDELKGAVIFLASDAAKYVTGQVLVVDGGYTAW